MKAREIEIEFFRRKGVYRNAPRSQALQRNAKIIRLKRTDTNKGDRDSPNYRSRLVGM